MKVQVKAVGKSLLNLGKLKMHFIIEECLVTMSKYCFKKSTTIKILVNAVVYARETNSLVWGN